MTEFFLCDRNLFLWHKLIFVTETYFCHRTLFLSQKPFSVTKTYFCDRKLFLWQKTMSVTKTCFSNKNLFLYQKWEFLLSRIMEIMTLWSPDCKAKKGTQQKLVKYWLNVKSEDLWSPKIYHFASLWPNMITCLLIEVFWPFEICVIVNLFVFNAMLVLTWTLFPIGIQNIKD